jgi:1-phosphatidylinositol-3-phosphate 5-kinase
MAELNAASMNHLAIMLRQMLTTEGIPNVKDWEGVLLKMALRIAKEMTFISLPHRQGQDMDVRRYVKIKKIPGGNPKDSEYVDGAVITKNVAHKQMSRNVSHPRVMLVTFPLEFHRVEGQYMHFGQIVRQEKEYLTNLASRIAALRPHVVLVEKSVSRIALDALTKSNIAVARSVKPTAILTVARITQGDVFSSMDKLALEPRLGHCTKFRIQTFDHHLIPGQRKTYMRFEGCLADMGCTIILRGGDIQTLRRIKKVMRFLTFVVRNLKLETHLWKDTYLTLGPSLGPEAIPHGHHSRPSSDFASHLQSGLGLITPASTSFPNIAASIVGYAPTTAPNESTASIVAVGDEEERKGVPDEAAKQALLSKRVEESLEPYKTTFISVSATLRFPPPYPIQKMKDLDDELIAAKRAYDDEVIRSEERLQAKKKSLEAQQVPPTIAITSVKDLEQQQQETVNGSLEQDDISAQIEALPSTLLPATPNGVESFTPYGPYLSPAAMQEGESYFSPMNPIVSPLTSLHFTSPLIDQAATEHQEKKEPLKTVEDLERQSQYTLTKWKHEEHQRIWEWYLRKNKDDFVVEKYQNISLRHFAVPVDGLDTTRPCKLPTLEYITFYGENDLTLGQFIEKSASETLTQFLDPKAICDAKNCDQPLARHGKAFVHNETRVFVEVEQWDSQGPKVHSLLMSYPGAITTWTKCRMCSLQTPYANVSQELQRYSFSKFLEAYFYPPDVHLMREAGCQHNIYRHHYRYFSAKGMTIRFQADHVALQELVFPPFRIRVRPETQLEIKNREFNQLHMRNERWYDGLVHDLHQYAMEATTGEEEADQKLRQTLNVLLAKAETERRDVIQLINKIYRDTPPTDTLALNQVHAYRQDRIVAWQLDFDKLPKLKGGKDRERTPGKRTTAFGSMRAIWYDLQGPFGDSSFYSAQSEAEDGSTKSRRATGESTFSTSDVSESEKESMLESASTATTISSATSWPTMSEPSTAENERVEDVDEKGPNTPLPVTPASVAALDVEDEPKPEIPVEPQAELREDVEPPVPAIEVGPSDADKEDSEVPDPDPDSDSTIGAVGARARRKATESQRKPRKVSAARVRNGKMFNMIRRSTSSSTTPRCLISTWVPLPIGREYRRRPPPRALLITNRRLQSWLGSTLILFHRRPFKI